MLLSFSSVQLISSELSALAVMAVSSLSMEVSRYGHSEASTRVVRSKKDKPLSSRYSSIAKIFEVSHNYSNSAVLMAYLASSEPDEVLRSEYVNRATFCGIAGSLGAAYGQDVLRRVKQIEKWRDEE